MENERIAKKNIENMVNIILSLSVANDKRTEHYIYLYKTYWRYAPKWVLRNIISNKIVFIKIIIFENQKWQKIKMIFRGLFDGLRNKLGKIS